MCGRAGVVVVVAMCVMCAVGRVLPPPPTVQASVRSGKLRAAQVRLREPVLRLDQGHRLGAPDYLSRSVLDYPPAAQARLLEDHQDPEVTGGFFQGDMLGLTPEALEMNTRIALKWTVFPEKRWVNATIPYSISDLYGTSERVMIQTAIDTLTFMTCLKFVEWDGVTPDYLLIWPVTQHPGCWSFVGRKGGQQLMSLQPPDGRSKKCFKSLGKPIHELLHALGMFHEHARPDRDDYITIMTDNIIPEYVHNFKKQSAANTTFPFPYDYSSVMHYGHDFFSYARHEPSIVPKDPNAIIGQRVMLSKLDCLKLNDLYDCLDDPRDLLKYTSICTFLGYHQ